MSANKNSDSNDVVISGMTFTYSEPEPISPNLKIVKVSFEDMKTMFQQGMLQDMKPGVIR